MQSLTIPETTPFHSSRVPPAPIKSTPIRQSVSNNHKLGSIWSGNQLKLCSGNPRAPVDFTLPIRAQQVSDPVAEEFSLNTTFVLLSKRELWLADSQMQITESSDVAFPEGILAKLQHFVTVFRSTNLRPCTSRSCSKPWIRLLGSYWESVPLFWSRWLHSKVSAFKLRIRLPSRCAKLALSLQSYCKLISCKAETKLLSG